MDGRMDRVKTELTVDAVEQRKRRQSVSRIVLAIALVALGCYILQGFLRSLLWAGVLAIALAPLYERAQRRVRPGKHDVLLPLAFTAAATILVLIPLVLIGVQLAHEAGGIVRWLQQVRNEGLPPPAWLNRAPIMHDQIISWWQANLADPDSARALIGRLGRLNPMQMGRQLGAEVFHRSFDFVFTVVTLFFIFREGPRLGPKMLFAARRLFGPQGEPMARQMIASIHGTVDGLLLVGLGEGVVLGIGYAFAGAPHPALLGFITAVGGADSDGRRHRGRVGRGVGAGGRPHGGSRYVARRRHGADLRRRPHDPAGADRRHHQAAVRVGAARHSRRRRDVRPAGICSWARRVMAALILLWREWTRDATTAEPA